VGLGGGCLVKGIFGVERGELKVRNEKLKTGG